MAGFKDFSCSGWFSEDQVRLRWLWTSLLAHDDIFYALPLRALRILRDVSAKHNCTTFDDLRTLVVPDDFVKWRGCGTITLSYIAYALEKNTERESHIDAMEYIT